MAMAAKGVRLGETFSFKHGEAFRLALEICQAANAVPVGLYCMFTVLETEVGRDLRSSGK